jgi:hypothetical protein
VNREVALVGGINLTDAAETFRVLARALGERLRRVPDGETGPARSQWIQCQRPFFMQHPQFELLEDDPERPGAFRQPRVAAHGIYARTNDEMYRGRARLRDGVDPATLRFENIGYADWALESYALLRSLQDAGEVPAGWRFQVSLPSPRIPLTARMVFADQVDLVEPAYRDAFRREIERLAAEIPPERLAIQWDCTHPLEVESAEDDEARQALLDYMAALAGLVPEGVELGYHLCYGDFEHRHAWDPTDLGTCVTIANALAASAGRPIDWVHMPVPRSRDDVGYFEPLRELELPPETTVVLGLVHHTDGLDGTRRRIEAASRVRAGFAIATECGMGRRPRDTIDQLLHIHREAADLAAVAT